VSLLESERGASSSVTEIESDRMEKSLKMNFRSLTKLTPVEEEMKSQEKLEKLISKVKIHLRFSNPGTFVALLNSLTLYKKQVDEISKVASNFDPLNGLEANGFRSFLKISEILTEKVEEEILRLENEGQSLEPVLTFGV